MLGAQPGPNAPQVEVYDGTTVQVFPAPLGKRILALAVDYGLMGVALYAIMIVLMVFFGGLAAVAALAHDLPSLLSDAGKKASALLLILFILLVALVILTLAHGYFIYFEFKRGTTPGKKLFGLQVISAEGGRLTMRQCVLREIFRSYVDVPFIVPGLISAIVTERKQRIGDLVAGTVVVHSGRVEEVGESTFLPHEYYNDLLHRLNPKQLEEKDAREFLRFCSASYLTGGAQPSAEQLQYWDQIVRAQVAPEAASLDAQSLILFYAEFLYRRLR
jgi:uncharacterized RDD family membrane protein YckC